MMHNTYTKSFSLLGLLCLSAPPTAKAADLVYKDRYLAELVERVPLILKTYDAQTGRFGEGIWICRDQEQMLPLAVVYSNKGQGNPYYHDAKLLDVIMKSGDALIDDMDTNGQWVFRKKDGSTWGNISMPWLYSRWIRTYGMIREEMPAERRERWVKALTLGYAHIEKTQFARVHNIPAHHAMGLYAAGKALNRPEWCERAAAFIRKVIESQADGGYWSEGEGPVVRYNFVYVEAIGIYALMSGDKSVMPAVEKGIRFHTLFTYPSGQAVETIDLRNPYDADVLPGNVAFTLTPEGRAWLHNQWLCSKDGLLNNDAMALYVLHGQEGPIADTSSPSTDDLRILRDKGVDRAATWRRGPWFVCLSAYTAAIDPSRWHEDRQNMVSIWHKKTGLILGGGNTKLQPAWSNFTVGDTSLLQHKPGDEKPDFKPKGDLFHVPSAATLVREPLPGLDLTYGPEACRLRVRIKDDQTLEYTLEATTTSGKPVLGHVTLLPHLKANLETTGGEKVTLTEKPFDLTPQQLGGGLTYAGCRWTLPTAASLHWPALPHNPYRKDGRSEANEGRIEIRVPFDAQHKQYTLTLRVAQ